jgi:hypothetical protein
MSPKLVVISTAYKTRVALEKPCKERKGTLIGQSQDRRIFCSCRSSRHHFRSTFEQKTR